MTELAQAGWSGARAVSPERSSVVIASLSFLLSMYAVIVTVAPFHVFNFYAELVQSKGDPARQTLVLVALALALIAAARKFGVNAVRHVPFWPSVLIGWIVLSLVWSIAPDLALRRAGLVVGLTVAIYFSTVVIGPTRAVRLLIGLLVPVMLIDIVSVWAAPQAATHQISEQNLDLVGAWRGMHTHKNNAAPIATLALEMFLIGVLHFRHKRKFMAMGALAAVFIWGTHSKTTGAFGVGAVVLFLVSRHWMINRLKKPNGILVLLLACLFFTTVTILNIGPITDLIDNPSAFTGRVAIWRVLLMYAQLHPLTGSGFQSFWLVGADSPALQFDHGWIGMAAPHGHNGYLDTLATLGWPGLALTIMGVVVAPLHKVWTSSDLHPTLRAFCASWIIYTALQNLFESTLFSAGGGGVWSVWVLCMAILYGPRTESWLARRTSPGQPFARISPG